MEFYVKSYINEKAMKLHLGQGLIGMAGHGPDHFGSSDDSWNQSSFLNRLRYFYHSSPSLGESQQQMLVEVTSNDDSNSNSNNNVGGHLNCYSLGGEGTVIDIVLSVEKWLACYCQDLAAPCHGLFGFVTENGVEQNWVPFSEMNQQERRTIRVQPEGSMMDRDDENSPISIFLWFKRVCPLVNSNSEEERCIHRTVTNSEEEQSTSKIVRQTSTRRFSKEELPRQHKNTV